MVPGAACGRPEGPRRDDHVRAGASGRRRGPGPERAGAPGAHRAPRSRAPATTRQAGGRRAGRARTDPRCRGRAMPRGGPRSSAREDERVAREPARGADRAQAPRCGSATSGCRPPGPSATEPHPELVLGAVELHRRPPDPGEPERRARPGATSSGAGSRRGSARASAGRPARRVGRRLPDPPRTSGAPCRGRWSCARPTRQLSRCRERGGERARVRRLHR